MTEVLDLLTAINADARVSASAFRLAFVIARDGLEAGGLTIAYADLAASCHLSRATVIARVKLLEECGWLIVDRSVGSNTFRIQGSKKSTSQPMESDLQPEEFEFSTPKTVAVQILDPEPSFLPAVITERAPTISVTPVTIVANGFEDFWRQYPRRVDKAAARKVYERVVKSGLATADTLLHAAMRYSAERSGEDPQFTKHPTTWLNKGSWENESQPAARSQSISGSAREGMREMLGIIKGRQSVRDASIEEGLMRFGNGSPSTLDDIISDLGRRR